MLYATGLTEEDMDKPQVGIASMGWEGNTCNMHLNDLAAKVKKGVDEAGHTAGRYRMAAARLSSHAIEQGENGAVRRSGCHLRTDQTVPAL